MTQTNNKIDIGKRLDKAWYKHVQSTKEAHRLLREIISCITNVDDSEYYIAGLSIETNPADGFILCDDDGKNLSVTTIVKIIKSQGFISMSQLKATSI